MSDRTNAEGPKGWPYPRQALAILRRAKRPGRLAQQVASLGLQAASLALPVVRQPTPVQKPKRPVPQPHHRGSAKRRRRAGLPALVLILALPAVATAMGGCAGHGGCLRSLGRGGGLVSTTAARGVRAAGFSSLVAAFRDPPVSARPKVRWWWASPLDDKEIAAEVNAIADAGFGGAEIAYDSGAWGSSAQRDALKTALDTARARGIGMDMTMGASWPVTTPNTGGDKTSPDHSQELAYGVLNLAGPAPYVGPPPPAQDLGAPVASGLSANVGPVSQKLVAVVAGLVSGEGTPVVYPAPGVAYQPAAPTAPAKSTVLDPSSLVDLTSQIDANGLVHFTPPSPGHWALFALYQRPTIQGVMNYLSPSAAGTVTKYLDANQIGSENAASLIPGSEFFEDSLELVYNGIPWTDGFQKTFKQLWGYDITPYLPAMFIQDEYQSPGFDPAKMPNPDYDVAGGVGARVRYDYWQTLNYMYVHDHLLPFQAWSRAQGMRHRAQVAYGSPFDMTMAARALDEAGGVADVETRNAGDPTGLQSSNWHFALDLYRAMAGGAHQAGENVISSELLATNARDYMTSLSENKAAMDKQWAAGVSDPIVQGFAYLPPGTAWPGREEFFGLVAQDWNQRYLPEWQMWRPLTEYWSRGDFVLQSGRPQEDVVIYHDAPTTFQNTTADQAYSNANYQVDPQLPAPVFTDNEGNHPLEQQAGLANPTPFFDTQPLETAGYTLEYIDPAGLLDPRAPGHGVLYPNGPSYRALVIDQSSMPGAAAQALAEDVGRGLALVIVGSPPSQGVSLADPKRENAQVQAAFKQILASPRSRVVASQGDVVDALRSLGVQPAVGFSQPEAVYSQHRRTASADLWYLWNADSHPASFTASFAATGTPNTMDLWSGDVQPVARYHVGGGRVEVPISLRPGQTSVLAFDHAMPASSLHVVATNAQTVLLHPASVEVQDTSAGTRYVALSNGQWRSVTLGALPPPLQPSSWHLHVDGSDPSGTSTYDVDLTSLQDWRNISQLAKVSGLGTYNTTLNVPASWLTADRGAYLDLGAIDGSIQAYLNGQLVTPTATPDTAYTLPFPAIPHVMGTVDVTRLLHPGSNTLRVVLATTLENALVGQAQQGNGNFATHAAGPTQPYGLLGPVSLVPYSRAVIGFGSGAG